MNSWPELRLRRDLGTLESYATLVGMLVGAGIFAVIRDAWRETGAGVLLGYLLFAPAILASSVPYAVFLSTPLGRVPGGEYTHIGTVLRSPALAFVGAWLKIISYIGAMAYLADVLALHLAELVGLELAGGARTAVGLCSLAFFTFVHAAGVRWFGRLQVWMCLVLGAAVVTLVVPGVFQVRGEYLTPVFSGGFQGFAACLPLLFFAYAGFEALAHSAGEVDRSTQRLPRVFVFGICGTTIVYLLLSLVIIGTVPPADLDATDTPAAVAASAVLPEGLVFVVTLGVIAAIATSLNATMLVPSRLALMLVRDGAAPRMLGAIHAGTGTPIVGLVATFAGCAALLVSGQLGLALRIAVFALVALYFLHGIAFLLLPSRAPELHEQATVRPGRAAHVGCALLSLFAMGSLLVVQVVEDVDLMSATPVDERFAAGNFAVIELVAGWTVLGLLAYAAARRANRST